MFKETSLTYLFDITGLIAGFLIAFQLGIFRLAPWAIALYPAVLSIKSLVSGLLSGRLSTAVAFGHDFSVFSQKF